MISTPHGELKPQRDGDTSLMSIDIDLFGTTKEIRSIQRIKMKLSVINVSDISSADGNKIDENFYFTKSITHQRNTYA